MRTAGRSTTVRSVIASSTQKRSKVIIGNDARWTELSRPTGHLSVPVGGLCYWLGFLLEIADENCLPRQAWRERNERRQHHVREVCEANCARTRASQVYCAEWTLMKVVIDSLVEGAGRATGIVAVIDVFRAFTCAAVVRANGASCIVMVRSG